MNANLSISFCKPVLLMTGHGRVSRSAGGLQAAPTPSKGEIESCRGRLRTELQWDALTRRTFRLGTTNVRRRRAKLCISEHRTGPRIVRHDARS